MNRIRAALLSRRIPPEHTFDALVIKKALSLRSAVAADYIDQAFKLFVLAI